MGRNHKKTVRGLLWRLAPAVLLAALFVAPIQPARASGFCDPCVTTAVEAETADLSLLLGAIQLLLDNLVLDPIAGFPAITNALYGGPIPGVPPAGLGIDADMMTGFKQINKSIEILATTIMPMHAQMGADKTKLYNDVQGQANLAPHAVVSDKSTHCAATYAGQLRDIMDGFVDSFTRATMMIVRNRDSGAMGPLISAAQTTCEHAPYLSNGDVQSQRYNSDVAKNIAGCLQSDTIGASKMPDYLIDGDLDMGNVFDKLTLSLPDKIKKTPNNHVQFTPASDAEWEFVAAWRFCEQYAPGSTMLPGSNGSTGMSVTDVGAVQQNARSVIMKVPVITACMRAIAYRTACSKGSESDFQMTSAGDDCWQIQDKACARLTRTPTSGMGITATGNADVDYALKHCDEDGLSEAAFDYAMAHRCGDINYTMVVLPSEHGKASSMGESLDACRKEAHDYEAKMAKEKHDFHEALSLLGSVGGEK